MPSAIADEIDVLSKAKRAIGDNIPTDDEPYMSPAHLDYFRKLLQEWKKSIHDASADTLAQLQEDGPFRDADPNDRASNETEWGIELRRSDRQRKLINKIDSALRRIDEGEYGYCEVTGEPIGLGRLIARPVATMTVEAQSAHERREKISRDD